jgi:hypothetical protein
MWDNDAVLRTIANALDVPLANRLVALCVCAAAMTAAPSALAAKAKAKPRPAKWVVLIHESGAVPAGWAQALRAAAERSGVSRSWIEPPAISLEEVQLSLGCASWGAACAGQAASLMGADNALVVDIVRGGDAMVVSVEDVAANGTVVGDVVRVEVSADDSGRAVASAWVVGAIRGTRPTVLVVTADLAGTEVLIDGEPRGVTPLTLIDVVAPGEHALLLRREGRAPLSRTFTVQGATMNREFGALTQGPSMVTTPRVGEEAPAPMITSARPGGGVPTMALAGFSLGGVGVLGAAAGAVVAALNWNARAAFVEVRNGAESISPTVCTNADGSYGSSGAGCVVIDGADKSPALLADIQRASDTLLGNVNVGLVVMGAGLLVGATGFAIGFGAIPGETQDAAGSPAPAASH